MASIVLDGMFLHDLDNLEDFVCLPRMDPRYGLDPHNTVFEGAAGNVRQVERVGRSDTWSLSMGITTDAAGWIDGHAKQTLLYRDPRGRREAVTVTAVDVSDLRHGMSVVSLSMTVVSWVEGV